MSKRILFITPIPSHPQNAGHRARIYWLMKSCCMLGHDVHVLYLEGFNQGLDSNVHAMQDEWNNNVYLLPYFESANAITRGKANTPRSKWCVDDWFDDRVVSELHRVYEKVLPNMIVAEYASVSKALTYCPTGVAMLIDTMDVFSLRSIRMKERNLPTGDWYSFSTDDEIRALERADQVLAISEADATYFQSVLSSPVHTIGHLQPGQGIIRQQTHEPTIGVIASGGASNVYYVQHFIENIFPFISKKLPDCVLYIAGKVSTRLRDLPPGCRVLGEVMSPEDLFLRCKLVVNPEQFGTGVSIKSITALSHGMPLVSTESGVRGITDGEGSAFYAARTDVEFIEGILEVLQSELIRKRFSEGAYAFHTAYVQKQQKALSELLAE